MQAMVSPARPPLPAVRRSDQNFYLALLVAAWVGIIMGFGGSIAHHISAHGTPYPAIVHVHAFVFVAWLVLFTVQVLLIRFRKIGAHRKLGLAMAGLAAVMIVIGPATALHMQHLQAGQPHADPGFLSVQFTDILAFAGLIAFGLLFRGVPTVHKRLMLLGTLYITDAGFARWLGDAIAAHAGSGPIGTWATLYSPPFALMLSIGVYDLATRRRLYGAYVAGLTWVLACQITAISLYGAAGWQALAKTIVARPW